MDRTRVIRRTLRFAAALVAAIGATGCAQDSATLEAATSTSQPDVLATIGAEQITMADVRAAMGEQLDQLEIRYARQRHKTIETTVQKLVWDRVIAAEMKKQNKSVDELLAVEAGSAIDPTPAEVKAWYDANRALVGQPFVQIERQIGDMLRNQRRVDAAMKLEERLTAEHKVVMLLGPYRVDLRNEGAPTLGASSAPVTLVEFSDFQCPFCKGFVNTLERLKETHAAQVQVVYRQFPIPGLHANAFKAAEASLCAHEQGKFWEMHDLMFEEQEKLTVSELKEKAVRLKMNKANFDNCLDTGRYVEQVQNDIKEGQKYGVTGTPALFLNGVLLDGGNVPYDALVKLIEKEIARGRK